MLYPLLSKKEATGKLDMAKEQTVAQTEPQQAYLVKTQNPMFSGELGTIHFYNGQALVDQAGVDKLRADFKQGTFSITSVNPLDVLQSAHPAEVVSANSMQAILDAAH